MRRPAPSKPATAPSAAQTLQRAGFAPLVLEPRVLFDAAGVETAVDVAAQADGADPFVPDATPDAGLAEAAAAAVPPAAETTAAPVTATATAPAPTAASQDSRVLVFVDSRVADQSTLLAGLPSGAEVVQIDAGSDGLAQIASAVQGRTGLDAIHIVGHGASGEILLGDTRLDSVGLTTRAAELAGIGAALGADGDILLYGCDVGSGEAGAAFVSGLAAATGADVAASTDATGAAALGGDWELERSAGTVEAATLFTGTGGWEHRLAAISLSSSTAWIPVLVGPNHDPNNDTQANNADLDLVGNASNPLLYYQFDDGGTPSLTDGTLAYRFRVGDDSFGAVALVGVDADRDGDLDLFLSVDKAGGNASSHAVKIWAPGNGANNSPSTTSLTAPTSQKTYALTAANYLLSSTGSDLDGDGNTDSFVSFSLPFADVVSEMSRIANISINQNTVMQYVALTLTQTNSINGDIGGINGGSSSSTTFASLGAFSAPLSASNLFPTISATNSVNVAENTTTVATVAGTDADGDTLTYSITGGDDAAKFSVTSDGKLTFVSAPDFESPQDVGSNNTYIVKVTASDGKGGTAEQTITVTVTDAAEGGGNQAPTLGSVPANASYTEGGTAVAVFSGITVSDDGANLTGATVTIAANRESTDVLAFTNANGITGSYDSSTGTLTLTGTASKAAYETAIRAITFSSTSDNPSTSSRTVTVTVTDGSLSSTAGSTTVSVARSNDAPTIAAPASIGVTEDTATALTGISFSDADAGTAAVTVTLGVATGSLAATSGGSVTVGGSGTGTLTLTGSVANINSFIAASGVTFTTASNATSAVTLSVGIDDGG
ncbi:MAG TPA: DUF4347 domain-containing protein, partial [Alphaproteobacteria bacterium]|nr:DUF4347 domain-containing protein [Alphaproteobacteria bacterium]